MTNGEVLDGMSGEEAAFAMYRSSQKLPCFGCSFFRLESDGGYCSCLSSYRICRESFEQWKGEKMQNAECGIQNEEL